VLPFVLGAVAVAGVLARRSLAAGAGGWRAAAERFVKAWLDGDRGAT
jgi:hypothetical protein